MKMCFTIASFELMQERGTTHAVFELRECIALGVVS